jgi:arylsulfatase A-like enzyme
MSPRHTQLSRLLLACLLATTTACQTQPAAEPEPAAAATEPTDTLDAELEPAKAALSPAEELAALATAEHDWSEPGVLLTDLVNARLGFHVLQDGPVLDLGDAPAAKYIQGRWRAPWLSAIRISPEEAESARLPELAQRLVAWNEGAGASLRFPVPEDLPQDTDYRLLIKLRPKNNPRVEIRLNEYSTTVEMTPGWQTLDVHIPASAIRFGAENTLSFICAASFFEGSDRVALRFDYLRLVPKARAAFWKEPQPLLDFYEPNARIFQTRRPALALPSPFRLDYYTVIPEQARLRLFAAPAPSTQSPTPLSIDLVTEDGQRHNIYSGELTGDDPWLPIDADLQPYAGQAARISFSVSPSPRGPTLDRPAIYLGEPSIRWFPKELPTVASQDPTQRIIVVAVNALRADRISTAEGLQAAPFLAQLARDGVWLDAVASGAGSIVPTVSLLTGCYPDNHGVFDTQTHIRSSLYTIGEVFEEAGWETALHSGDPFVSMTKGYAQGFDRYRNLFEEQVSTKTDVLVEGVVRLLKKTSTTPRCYYLQTASLRLPHSPSPESLERFYAGIYNGPITIESMLNPATIPMPLAPEDRRYLNALYDADLFEIDAQLATLYAAAAESGDLENTLFVVLGTHGEPLGEDPALGYNNQLSDAELRVPVLLSMPSRLPKGLRPKQSIEFLDLLPTLAELAGVPLPDEGIQGSSLIELVEGRKDDASAPAFSAKSNTHRAVSMGRYHYLLRSGDNDLLFNREASAARDDIRSQNPMAHRALRDALALQLSFAASIDKRVHGSTHAPSQALAPYALQRGW